MTRGLGSSIASWVQCSALRVQCSAVRVQWNGEENQTSRKPTKYWQSPWPQKTSVCQQMCAGVFPGGGSLKQAAAMLKVFAEALNKFGLELDVPLSGQADGQWANLTAFCVNCQYAGVALPMPAIARKKNVPPNILNCKDSASRVPLVSMLARISGKRNLQSGFSPQLLAAPFWDPSNTEIRGRAGGGVSVDSPMADGRLFRKHWYLWAQDSDSAHKFVKDVGNGWDAYGTQAEPGEKTPRGRCRNGWAVFSKSRRRLLNKGATLSNRAEYLWAAAEAVITASSGGRTQGDQQSALIDSTMLAMPRKRGPQLEVGNEHFWDWKKRYPIIS